MDDLSSRSRRPAPLKPELPDYLCLNFVGGGQWDTQSVAGPSPVALRSSEDVGGFGDDSRDSDKSDGSSDEDSTTTDECMWRGSGGTHRTHTPSRPASTHAPKPAERASDVPTSSNEREEAKTERGEAGGSAEARLYPRTLGSSVSVLDEKDAVLRTGGTRFAGEDLIRGRLRAADPFLWMGRLHAGATAISGLIDQANGALGGLDDASSDVDSTASSGRGGDRRGTNKTERAASSREGVVGPASRGSAKASWRPGGLGGGMMSSLEIGESVGETEKDDGSEDGEDRGGSVAADADVQRVSSSESGAVDLMSSTMSSYSQAVETNRVMAGGMLIEMEEESGESDGENVSQLATTNTAKQSKDPVIRCHENFTRNN